MRLATSVLAIMQILIDIFSFLSVLIVFLLGFAQIFTTFDLFKVGDMNFWKNFRRTYYILLGEFEMTNVTIDGKFAFFFVFTFFVIIILLNVLIAIVGDSYEKSLIHSEKLFGRARVETVAELVALEQFFFRPSSPATTKQTRRAIEYSAFRSILVLFVCCIVAALLAFSIFITNKNINQMQWLDFVSISLVFLLLLGQIVSIFVITLVDRRTFFGKCLHSARNNNFLFFAEWIHKLVQELMRKILGTSTTSQEDKELWNGRVRHIEKQVRRALVEYEDRARTDMAHDRRSMDARLQTMEVQLKFDILSAIKNLNDTVKANSESH